MDTYGAYPAQVQLRAAAVPFSSCVSEAAPGIYIAKTASRPQCMHWSRGRGKQPFQRTKGSPSRRLVILQREEGFDSKDGGNVGHQMCGGPLNLIAVEPVSGLGCRLCLAFAALACTVVVRLARVPCQIYCHCRQCLGVNVLEPS